MGFLPRKTGGTREGTDAEAATVEPWNREDSCSHPYSLHDSATYLRTGSCGPRRRRVRHRLLLLLFRRRQGGGCGAEVGGAQVLGLAQLGKLWNAHILQKKNPNRRNLTHINGILG